MKIIGITGGVGAGKSAIMEFLGKNYNAKVVRADEVAHLVTQPGKACYMRLVSLLNDDILREDGSIDRQKMAAKIFTDKGLLASVNSIIHPAVREYIIQDIEREEKLGKRDFYFLEAALLIEEGYEQVCDELWYIYASDDVRRQRLKMSRGYSDEKTESIMKNQLSDDMFRRYARVVIDNSGTLEESFKQIEGVING
ncbi:dephospho-CoA kinase [Lachnospiraceae bacterium C1.1]|nr:dephospho-CoA kinase [Lachnospiraceae bacterium C1.1]